MNIPGISVTTRCSTDIYARFAPLCLLKYRMGFDGPDVDADPL